MALTITEDQLEAIMPRCRDAAGWCPSLNAALARWGIDEARRAAAFLAQVAHESAELARVVENLDYSAVGLTRTWPRRFPTLGDAQPYAGHPEKLANRVYASRLGNGDEASGDGWRFRGRGLIQLTGRASYQAAGRALSLPLEAEPDRLAERDVAALSAGWFWESHLLNALADDRTRTDDDDFVAITVKINGGTTGLAARRVYWQRAKSVLGVA
jgi:putative chitinase